MAEGSQALSLYIHLPWCVRKCPYCDFNSYTAGADAPRERYVEALLADLRHEAARAPDREVRSVFMGGGTPSFFSPQHIARILDAAASELRLSSDVEITMEVNPGTVEGGDTAGYRRAGVNRLSIGAQSFDDDMLRRLGRIHNPADIERSFIGAREAGFENINLDLMYGLPGQDLQGALDDLYRAGGLRPDHLSWYQLTLEPNTVFYARPPAGLPDDDASFEIQQAGQRLLGELGFEQYEVSAYARPGKRCRHNLNYWTYGDYLAIGAGAHGKIRLKEEIWRYRKPANPLAYMEAAEQGAPDEDLRIVSAEDRLFEFMLNALRLNDGFDDAAFCERTGLSAELLHQRLSGVVKKGLMVEDSPGIWRVTPQGGHFLNNLQAEFLP